MVITDIIFRILLAICVGGFIGYEREMRNRPAGFITHTLVCVGACVVSLIQIQMIHDTITLIDTNPVLANAMKADLGRVVAQVITGVGFLGAGTIIFDKGSVKGLTTATTIWVVACIGLAIGLGYYQIAIISTTGIAFIIIGLKQFEVKARNRKFSLQLEIVYQSDNTSFIESTAKLFHKNRVQVRDIRILKSDSPEESRCRFSIYSGIVHDKEKLISKLLSDRSVIALTRLN